LGEALYKIENYEDATKAFQIALKIAPKMIKPHEWLMKIFTEKIVNEELALKSKKIIEENKQGTIFLLNGIEVFDYSSIFNLLDSEGINVISEGAIDLRIKTSLIIETKENTNLVFVPAQVLTTLPSFYNYKFIEIVTPKSELLEKINGNSNSKKEVKLTQLQELERIENLKVNWLESNPSVEYFELDYSSIVKNDKEEVLRLKDFLNSFSS
jgi:hypothetical protein